MHSVRAVRFYLSVILNVSCTFASALHFSAEPLFNKIGSVFASVVSWLIYGVMVSPYHVPDIGDRL